MSDPLDLIAEAQRRQKEAERDRDYWKSRAERERERLVLVIDFAKRRNIPDLKLTAEGFPYWDGALYAINEFAKVLRDPHAGFSDDYCDGMTHGMAVDLLAMRLQDIVKKALEAKA